MSNDETALGRAILDGELDVVRQLVAAGAPVNERMEYFRALPIAYAVEHGQAEILKFLIASGADINARLDDFESRPLHLAIQNGRVEIMRILLAAGADSHALNKLDFTPFEQACTHRGGQAGVMLRELLARGADPHRLSRTWGTPLIKACWRGHVSAVKELLKQQADANFMSENGTPLICAVDNNRPDVVITLLLHGVDPNLKYVYPHVTPGNPAYLNKTPLEYARQLKLKKLVALLTSTRAELEALIAPAPVTAADVPQLWKRVEKAVRKVSPNIKKSLRKGATDANRSALEQACGVELPADYRASLAIHDGQTEGDEPLVPEDWVDGPYDLLPAKEIITEWKMWKGLLDGGEFRGQTSTPDEGIRNDWWHPGWVPVATNYSGDYLCLDLAPIAPGRTGQVIEMRHDAEGRRLLAGSFAEFLRELADRWESLAAS